jgi:hypothetical protein
MRAAYGRVFAAEPRADEAHQGLHTRQRPGMTGRVDDHASEPGVVLAKCGLQIGADLIGIGANLFYGVGPVICERLG